MCGIAGGTGLDDDVRRRVLTDQLASLRRRGPDSWGFHVGHGAAVGQTRLAVIDVERGDPPLHDESGSITVALNGEIYNYRELRQGLLERGHRFSSDGDTEVIAHLAEELEPLELAASLQGMFAFAIWDERRQRLVLGRDRLGKKPLHYWSDGRALVFGSEIKAVLADPRVPRVLDETVLASYLGHGYAPSPRTFFAGVVQLPPATVLVRDSAGLRTQRYWDAAPVTAEELLTGSSSELAAQLRDLLRQAVRDRLVADVPLGAFLSGGVDSSAVVGLMAEQLSEPVRTFCIGFEEAAYDERRWARLVADRFSTVHEEAVVQPDASRLLDDVLDACDQPFADSSALPTYLLAQMTRQHVTVALSGDGGDELFAGYERFAAGLALARAGRLPMGAGGLARAVGARVAGPDRTKRRAKVGRFLMQAAAGMPDAYTGWVQVFDAPALDALLPGSASGVLREYDAIWARSEGAPMLSRLLDLNRRTYLVDDLLVKADRMSMAHGLEVRSPLLDHRLVEFAVRVPPAEHLRGTKLKRLLKAAVADLVPDEVLARPKKGFGVPLDAWFRGPLREEARARLLAPQARIARHLQPAAVARLVAEHQAGTAAHGQRLWSLLMLERFLEREAW